MRTPLYTHEEIEAVSLAAVASSKKSGKSGPDNTSSVVNFVHAAVSLTFDHRAHEMPDVMRLAQVVKNMTWCFHTGTQAFLLLLRKSEVKPSPFAIYKTYEVLGEPTFGAAAALHVSALGAGDWGKEFLPTREPDGHFMPSKWAFGGNWDVAAPVMNVLNRTMLTASSRAMMPAIEDLVALHGLRGVLDPDYAARNKTFLVPGASDDGLPGFFTEAEAFFCGILGPQMCDAIVAHVTEANRPLSPDATEILAAYGMADKDIRRIEAAVLAHAVVSARANDGNDPSPAASTRARRHSI